MSKKNCRRNKNEVPPSGPGLPSEYRFKQKLGSAALTVAVLVFFVVVLTLTALFRLLLLTRLVTLLGFLSLLPVLTGLTTLLALLFRIVCHEYSSKISATISRLENLSTNC
jgi:hypothetical protein